MRPITVTTSGVSTSSVVPIDQYLAPCNIGLAVDVTGAVTCSVQHTFDDIWDPAFTPGGALWFNHPTLNALAADTDGNYAAPPRAIRLNQTAGAGSARLVIVQAGATG